MIRKLVNLQRAVGCMPWRQILRPALTFALTCLVWLWFVYIRSPLLSQLPAGAQLQRGGQSGGPPRIWKPGYIKFRVCMCLWQVFVSLCGTVTTVMQIFLLCLQLPGAVCWLAIGGLGGRGDLPVRIHRRSQLSCFCRECRQILYNLTYPPAQEPQEFGSNLLRHLLESFGFLGGIFKLGEDFYIAIWPFSGLTPPAREAQRGCAAVGSHCERTPAEHPQNLLLSM